MFLFHICGAHIWNKCVNTNHCFIFYRTVLKENQHSSVLWRYLQLLSVKVSTLQKELNAWWCGPTYTYFRSVQLKFASYFAEFTVYMLCVEQRFSKSGLRFKSGPNSKPSWTQPIYCIGNAEVRCDVVYVYCIQKQLYFYQWIVWFV